MSPRLPLMLACSLAVLATGCAAPGAGTPHAQAKHPAASVQARSAAEFHPADIEVVAAQFGVFGADPAGRRILYETDKFPGVVAAPFGWFIVFKTDKPTVVWREEFELPVAPPTWGPGEAMGIFQVTPDRRTAVTERIIPTKLGFIANEWRYASGDPIGCAQDAGLHRRPADPRVQLRHREGARRTRPAPQPASRRRPGVRLDHLTAAGRSDGRRSRHRPAPGRPPDVPKAGVP